MPPENINVVTRLLGPGEELLWRGSPGDAQLRRSALPWTIVGAVLSILIVVWGVLVGLAQPAWYFLGLPLLVVGGWWSSGPLRARRRARRTVYAVTDSRVLVVVGGILRTQVPRAKIHSITRIPGRGGSAELDLWGAKGEVYTVRDHGSTVGQISASEAGSVKTIHGQTARTGSSRESAPCLAELVGVTDPDGLLQALGQTARTVGWI